MPYGIAYLDMYDYGTCTRGPEFASADDAIAHATSVLDRYLKDTFEPGMTSEQLYDQFMTFGEDVVIASMDGAPSLNFSGQEYVRQRSMELCTTAKPTAARLECPGGSRSDRA